MGEGQDEGGRARSDRHRGNNLFAHPIVWIAFAIMLAVFVLIGSAIAGWDHGHVLRGMSETAFARGLITYLFATVTIGTAMVLVVSVLTTDNYDAHKEKFERGKEILSLLLGVFGTIVGFYFGAEVTAKGSQAGAGPLTVAPMRLSQTELAAGEKLTLTTVASGGKGPYRFGVSVGDKTPEAKEDADHGGWISTEVEAPDVQSRQVLSVRLLVKDADERDQEVVDRITVKPKRAPAPLPQAGSDASPP